MLSVVHSLYEIEKAPVHTPHSCCSHERKICAEARDLKRNESSSGQGSELPGGRDTDVAVAAVAAPEADDETLGVEDADDHAVAARVD